MLRILIARRLGNICLNMVNLINDIRIGAYLYTGTVVVDIAKSRAEVEAARLLVYSAALQVGG